MARILNRYGVGVPKGDAFAGVGEILIDAESGVAYTITIGGEVKPLGGGVTKSGVSNIDGGSASSVYLIDQVIDGGGA